MLANLIWRWERHRRHPVVARHRDLQQHFAARGSTTLAVLTVPKAMDDAIWSLWSWMKQLDRQVTPVLFVDGVIPPAARADLTFHFPELEIHELLPWLKERNLRPQLRRLVEVLPLGKKLAMIMTLQEQGALIYCDSDVLAFNRPDQLLDCMNHHRCAYMQDRYGGNYDPDILATAQQLDLKWIENLNAGLLHIPHQRLDPQFLEHFLSSHQKWDAMGSCWFTEQTLLAVQFRNIDCEPFASEQYVVSLNRQFFHEKDEDYTRLAARHFTGPVRHVMYLKGIPFLYRRELQMRKSAHAR